MTMTRNILMIFIKIRHYKTYGNTKLGMGGGWGRIVQKYVAKIEEKMTEWEKSECQRLIL